MRLSKFSAGFTLLEMVISIGIFSVVMVISIGLMLSVSSAQIKAANTQAVLDNIRFGLELITKEIRTGSNFSTASPLCAPLGSEIRFDAVSGRRIYFWDNIDFRIMRAKEDITGIDCSGSTGKAVPFSAEDVYIDRFNVITEGIIPGSSDGQSMITMVVRVRSKSPKIPLDSALDLQTTVIPRLRDLP